MAEYTYEPLDSQAGGIRLLQLLEPTPSAPHEIKCKIYCVSLQEQPHYKALSYCWGSEDKPYSIVVNGKGLPVTTSLYEALGYLREIDTKTPLWIDAICINQNDTVEKTFQVAQMRQIYRNAQLVVAWLGPSANDSDDAMRWIQQTGQQAIKLGIGGTEGIHLRNILKASLHGAQSDLAPEVQGFLKSLWCSLSDDLSVGKDHLGSLIEFFHRSYWRRVWVVQEAYNARALFFVCGREITDDKVLRRSLRLIRHVKDVRQQEDMPSRLANLNPLPAWGLLELRISSQEGRSPPLIYLLRKFRSAESRLKVDRVYALLGIASDGGTLDITPDYGLTESQALISVAHALLRNGYTDILSLCDSTLRDQEIPSWVPEWSSPSKQMNLQGRHHTFLGPSQAEFAPLSPRFDASAGLPLMLTAASRLKPTTLTLAAISLGRIERLGESTLLPYHNPIQWDTLQIWVEELAEYFSASITDRSKCVWAACETVIAFHESPRGTWIPKADTEMLKQLVGMFLREAEQNDFLSDAYKQYLELFKYFATYRRPLAIGDAYVGIGPSHAQVGDLVFVVAGGPVPLILRPSGSSNTYNLIGEAYVHNCMDGQVVTAKEGQMQLVHIV